MHPDIIFDQKPLASEEGRHLTQQTFQGTTFVAVFCLFYTGTFRMKATSLRDVVFLMVLMYYLPLYATLSAPPDQQAKVGENITFKCNVSVKSLLTTLKYSKNGSFERSKRIVYRTSEKSLTIERLFKYRVHVEPSGLLVLQNAQIRDGGFYKCYIELVDGRERLHKVK